MRNDIAKNMTSSYLDAFMCVSVKNRIKQAIKIKLNIIVNVNKGQQGGE